MSIKKALKYFLIIAVLFRLAVSLIPLDRDPWGWLEDMESPKVLEWVGKQNEAADRYLLPSTDRSAVEARIRELNAFSKMSLPVAKGGKLFSVVQGPQQKQGVLQSGETALVDPNALSEDGTVSLTGFQIDEEASLLLYGLSDGGTDVKSWHFMDLQSGSALPDVIEGASYSTPKWSQDSKGVYYTKLTDNHISGLFYHRLGSDQDDDPCLYRTEKQGQMIFGPHVAKDGRYLLIGMRESDDNYGLTLLDLQTNATKVIVPARKSACFPEDVKDGAAYVIEDNSRLLRINLTDPGDAQVMVEGDGRLMEAAFAGDYIVCRHMRDAVSELKVYDLEGRFLKEIDMPGKGTASLSASGDELYYSYTDFTTPVTLYKYDFETGTSTCFFRPSFCWNPSDFTTDQIFFTSSDGAEIPMFITYRKGLKIDSNTPALLYGYGGFNIPVTPGFSLLAMSWVDSGGIYVSVNLRGGGEYGSEWHDAGRLENKQNVFNDFISAAEWLIDNGYTSPAKLAINGRSNGGLLVGAALVQRPDLFGAAVPQVGVLDMLKFHKYTIGWFWKSDYGDPDKPKDRSNLLAYSPYHNIKRGTYYPRTLITTSEKDDRVVPMHSYKFAAALQEAQGSENPILLRVYKGTGHGSGRSAEQLAQETADIIMFLRNPS